MKLSQYNCPSRILTKLNYELVQIKIGAKLTQSKLNLSSGPDINLYDTTEGYALIGITCSWFSRYFIMKDYIFI